MKKSINFDVVFMFAGIFFFITHAPLFAGLADEIINLSNEYKLSACSDNFEAMAREKANFSRERELLDRLVASDEEMSKIADHANTIEHGLLKRLIDRVQFEIVQEGRANLRAPLAAMQAAFQNHNIEEMRVKKIAIIYGREVDLLDGEWKTAPDGRRYWVSNEYPDIVLSSADYRRYMATATTVQD